MLTTTAISIARILGREGEKHWCVCETTAELYCMSVLDLGVQGEERESQ